MNHKASTSTVTIFGLSGKKTKHNLNHVLNDKINNVALNVIEWGMEVGLKARELDTT